MATIQEIRLVNFEQLIREAGNVAELSRLCGYDKPAYFYQIRSQKPNSKGKILQIGNRVAAALEQGMNKPKGWLSQDHSQAAAQPAFTPAVSGSLKNEIQTVTLAFTGASGFPYGWRLLETLLATGKNVYVLFSQAARVVAKQEMNLDLPAEAEKIQAHLQAYFNVDASRLRVFAQDDWFAPIASGTGTADAMVICPASMGTIAAIAHGTSDSLMERAADVAIKEKRPLVLVPREAPLSALHLENLLKLARLGCTILPPAAGFYHQPKTVDDMINFVVARILDQLRISHNIIQSWGK
ncbi:putative aromatic acid decarboxylase [Kingella negevensis]|uniref:Flavin prenyltransferase UbiX n=1 Tax=Kingella negevensis TaxID=1522312 RepID=A0A238TCW1_9NEIS|nr:flavin prenyltransferase UbiX [Kingella negevensis]SNB63759.1 putative aromatic acid decarboxylase [Kingella negevensis]